HRALGRARRPPRPTAGADPARTPGARRGERHARALYLHPNSLRHRLGRIAELTGRNPLDFGDRVALTIGLWAWDKRPRGQRGG
ncbi:MAG TPA: helix-turn-helix domain-containing protein, partial [Actinomycetes bacterium]